MSNKQSSIEWLKDQLEHFGNKHELQVSWATVDELIEQAKAMHKEEIINSFGVGCHLESKRLVGYHDIAEQYYNETFNN
jgi:hypothetical protein